MRVTRPGKIEGLVQGQAASQLEIGTRISACVLSRLLPIPHWDSALAWGWQGAAEI